MLFFSLNYIQVYKSKPPSEVVHALRYIENYRKQKYLLRKLYGFKRTIKKKRYEKTKKDF